VVRRLVTPWRQPPCGAGVLGPQVESIDRRLAGLEGGRLSLDDAVAVLRAELDAHAELPSVVGEAMALVLIRLERVESELRRRSPVRPDDAG
jgi:hypothetical protein